MASRAKGQPPQAVAAARGRLRRRRSSPMRPGIAFVAPPCIRPRGARNATHTLLQHPASSFPVQPPCGFASPALRRCRSGGDGAFQLFAPGIPTGIGSIDCGAQETGFEVGLGRPEERCREEKEAHANRDGSRRRQWPRCPKREDADRDGDRSGRKEGTPSQPRQEIRSGPAALEKPERPGRRRPGQLGPEVGPGGRQEKCVRNGKRDRHGEEPARKRRRQPSRDCERAKEDDRKQVAVSERPASMPVRITGQEDEEGRDGRNHENGIGSILAGSPPRQGTRDGPDPEGREEEKAPRGVEEISPRDPRTRRSKTEETPSGELREGPVSLPRRRENPGGAKADGIVGEEEKEWDRRAGQEEEQRLQPPACRGPDYEHNGQRRRGVL